MRFRYCIHLQLTYRHGHVEHYVAHLSTYVIHVATKSITSACPSYFRTSPSPLKTIELLLVLSPNLHKPWNLSRITMKLLCLTGFLAAASAFTVTPSSFTTQTYSVGEKGLSNMGDSPVSHRTRRATVVMDGKANGASITWNYIVFSVFVVI